MSKRGLLLLMLLGVVTIAIVSRVRVASALAGSFLQENQADALPTPMSVGNMAHMFMTSLRPEKPGDQQKADAIVAAAKTAMAPYQDYRKALADGFVIFLRMSRNPNITLPSTSMAWRHDGISIL